MIELPQEKNFLVLEKRKRLYGLDLEITVCVAVCYDRYFSDFTVLDVSTGALSCKSKFC